MNGGEELTVRQALGEIGRVSREVRRSARWGIRYFVVLGVLTAVFWAMTHFAAEPIADAAVIGWLAFCVGSIFCTCRNRVYDRVFWRLQYVVTGVYLAGTAFNVWVSRYVQEGEGAGPMLAGMAGVVLASAAPLYAAWRGWLSLNDRKGLVAGQ